ncbi:MAG: Nicotinamide-nucleotide adenylyltransferase [Anaerolineales bacterium]|nr:Nicotinamide-nucleotide adenylyltransferase [Anaerolineales bacterium]
MPNKKYTRIAMIARWKPVHLGHAAILRALCGNGEEALIGIGSSNRYNARNPFTLDETRDMIQLVLAGFSNYRIVPVPDLDDGPRWRVMVKELFGALDAFVTENPYVTHLLADDYRVIRPVELIPPRERVPAEGSAVRRLMAQGADWESLVPTAVAEYIKSNRLDLRFRNEFGLETLAMMTVVEGASHSEDR